VGGGLQAIGTGGGLARGRCLDAVDGGGGAGGCCGTGDALVCRSQGTPARPPRSDGKVRLGRQVAVERVCRVLAYEGEWDGQDCHPSIKTHVRPDVMAEDRAASRRIRAKLWFRDGRRAVVAGW